jgi:hypothetical protein
VVPEGGAPGDVEPKDQEFARSVGERTGDSERSPRSELKPRVRELQAQRKVIAIAASAARIRKLQVGVTACVVERLLPRNPLLNFSLQREEGRIT